MADPRAYLADPDDAAPASAGPASEWPELLEQTHVTVTVPRDYLIGVARFKDPKSAVAEFGARIGDVRAYLTRSQAIRLRDELTARLAEVGA